MAQDYWLIKIGETWLTDDGTEDGDPCRTEVTGLSPLFLSTAFSAKKAADGTTYLFTTPTDGQGVDVGIRVAAMNMEEFQLIMDVIDDALSSGDNIPLEISHDSVTFQMDALPGPVEQPAQFTAGLFNNVGFSFTVVAKTA